MARFYHRPAILNWSDVRDSMVFKGQWAEVWRSCQKIGGEDQEGGDGSQIFEEPAAAPHLHPRLAPEIFGQIADGMEGESQKVERNKHGGKIDFPVPEVVFEMVAVVLQDVEAFILDLPARPATGGEVDHRVGRDVEVG